MSNMPNVRVLSQKISRKPPQKRGALLKIFYTTRTFGILIILAYASVASSECLKVGGVSVKVEVAKTEVEHARGLMFRESLPANSGMWFVFGHPHGSAFWMKNTFIPLDIIFVSQDLRILSIHENAKPFDLSPISSPVPYWYVLEVPAGFVKQHQLRVGDRIRDLSPKC